MSVWAQNQSLWDRDWPRPSYRLFNKTTLFSGQQADSNSALLVYSVIYIPIQYSVHNTASFIIIRSCAPPLYSHVPRHYTVIYPVIIRSCAPPLYSHIPRQYTVMYPVIVVMYPASIQSCTPTLYSHVPRHYTVMYPVIILSCTP